MEDIHKSVATQTTAVANGSDKHLPISGLSDKRLALYGYTIETINMLLLPMVQNK